MSTRQEVGEIPEDGYLFTIQPYTVTDELYPQYLDPSSLNSAEQIIIAAYREIETTHEGTQAIFESSNSVVPQEPGTTVVFPRDYNNFLGPQEEQNLIAAGWRILLFNDRNGNLASLDIIRQPLTSSKPSSIFAPVPSGRVQAPNIIPFKRPL